MRDLHSVASRVGVAAIFALAIALSKDRRCCPTVHHDSLIKFRESRIPKKLSCGEGLEDDLSAEATKHQVLSPRSLEKDRIVWERCLDRGLNIPRGWYTGTDGFEVSYDPVVDSLG